MSAAELRERLSAATSAADLEEAIATATSLVGDAAGMLDEALNEARQRLASMRPVASGAMMTGEYDTVVTIGTTLEGADFQDVVHDDHSEAGSDKDEEEVDDVEAPPPMKEHLSGLDNSKEAHEVRS